jgi:hypothetical protein
MENEERGDAVRHSQAPTPTLVSDGYPRAPPLQQAQSEGVCVYEFPLAMTKSKQESVCMIVFRLCFSSAACLSVRVCAHLCFCFCMIV